MTVLSTTGKSAAIYARVSTTDQSCDVQVAALVEYAGRMGWPNPRVFRDDGVSGIRENRPALDQLRAEVRAGKVSTVMATKLDRLGRSVLGVHRFFEEVEGAGCRVIVTDQGYDSAASSPSARLLRNVLADLAEFERELILERTQAGVAKARKKGVRFGRTPKSVPEGVPERIMALRGSGASWRSIAQHVGVGTNRVQRIYERTTVPKVSPIPKAGGSSSAQAVVVPDPSPVPEVPSFGTPSRSPQRWGAQT